MKKLIFRLYNSLRHSLTEASYISFNHETSTLSSSSSFYDTIIIIIIMDDERVICNACWCRLLDARWEEEKNLHRYAFCMGQEGGWAREEDWKRGLGDTRGVGVGDVEFVHLFTNKKTDKKFAIEKKNSIDYGNLLCGLPLEALL